MTASNPEPWNRALAATFLHQAGHMVDRPTREQMGLSGARTDGHGEGVDQRVNAGAPLSEERVEVEQRAVEERPLTEADASATAFQEGTIRIPVRGEELVVHKRPVVARELVVTKQRTTQPALVTGTVRREQANVDSVRVD